VLEGLQLGVSLSLMARTSMAKINDDKDQRWKTIAMERTTKSRSDAIARWMKSRSGEIAKVVMSLGIMVCVTLFLKTFECVH
jgi:hypothetical protein